MNEQTTRVLNWKRSPYDGRDLKSTRHLSAPITLPEEFQITPEIPIYDQKNAGSCVGHGCCEAFRYETAQLLNNYNLDFSRLFVYWNARSLDGSTEEDAGTYIRSGFKAMNKWGLCSESVWPYDDTLSSVVKRPSESAYEDGLNNITVKYATVNQTEQEIKQTLLSGAAIVFGFNVYTSFFGSWSETTGIMPLPKSSDYLQGGHCVIVVGYSNNKKAFLCQNSWGDWGKGAIKGKVGYFWMPYSFLLNSKECDDFWCIQEVKIKGEVVPPTPSTINWVEVSNILFKTSKELYAVKKPTILRLGQALGLQMDEKKNFAYNYNIVKTKLGL